MPLSLSALLLLPVVLPWREPRRSCWAGGPSGPSRSTLTAVTALAVALLVVVDRDGPVSSAAAAGRALGITLVADRLSAMMLVVAALMLLSVLVYAIGQPGAERNRRLPVRVPDPGRGWRPPS